MVKAVVHVHQAEAKKKDPVNHPAIIVRTYKGSKRYREILIEGDVTLVHRQTPDSCGATISITCDSDQITGVA